MMTISKTNVEEIKGALRAGLRVRASMSEGGQGFIVKNARRNMGRVQVLTAEGWRAPAAVWTEDADGQHAGRAAEQ